MEKQILRVCEMLTYSESKTLPGGSTKENCKFLFQGQLKQLIYPNVDMIALALNYTVCKREIITNN